jgi:hypothetical protein
MRKNASQAIESGHHRPAGWRYILVELGIVTVGLFIALMLNSVVEWAHHKQLVRDARRNIHREVEQNRSKVRADLGSLRSSLAQVDANIATLHRIQAGRFSHGSLGNGITFDTFDEAAWQTARDSGALSYMPYDEAQRYSGLYSTLEFVNARAAGVVESDFDAFAPAEMGYDIRRLPAEETTAMLRANAQVKIGLVTLIQLVGELDAELAKESGTNRSS